jgi:diguanylate cyclase (GGDEF)-like protein
MISVGIATYPQHGDGPEALLQAADEALYAAKRHGGNTVSVAGEGPSSI